MFAIKDLNSGEIFEDTVSNYEETAWTKYLGFKARDDQWSYQKQQAEASNIFCVKVELTQIPDLDIDKYIKESQELYEKIYGRRKD